MGGAADTDGDALVRVSPVRNVKLLDGVADLFGDGVRALGFGVGENDDELFSAVTSQQIGRTVNHGAGAVGDLAKTGIALHVAVEVVVGLEVIYVE